MSNLPSIPFSRRTNEDIVVRDDERHRRGDIDRGIRSADFLFSVLSYRYGDGASGYKGEVQPWSHPENTPSEVAACIVRAVGRVAIADIGCGTLHTVITWRNKIASLTKCGMSSIDAVGVTRRDFTGESMHRGTNSAARAKRPPVRCIIADARHMTAVETASRDVVLALHSLRYAADPDQWLSEMVRIARPGGTLLFNSSFKQSEDGQPLERFLSGLHQSGYPILQANLMMPDLTPGAPPAELQPMLGMTENNVLYRVDIPRS